MGGDVITFISKIENCSQLEAAKHLAKTYQIELPEELSKDIAGQTAGKEQYYNICATLANWCHEQLLKAPHVMKYLQERGFTKQSITLYKLGYFPGGTRTIRTLTSYMSNNSFIIKDLLDAKIIAEGKTGLYSSFEERILFPIKDIVGRFCGFGGRVFKPFDKRAKFGRWLSNIGY